MPTLTDFSQWGKLRARIQQAAECKLKNNSDGLAVVSIKVVINSAGEPVIWLEPYAERVEPSRQFDLLTRLCSGD